MYGIEKKNNAVEDKTIKEWNNPFYSSEKERFDDVWNNPYDYYDYSKGEWA